MKKTKMTENRKSVYIREYFKEKIKPIMFILIFIIILLLVIKVLWLPANAITYFYKEPKNSLDITYIGSSNAFIHFNTTLAYNLYGFTTGMFSTHSQPFYFAKYLIKDSEKYQKPSLYVIDLSLAGNDMTQIAGEHIRQTTDAMKFSKNRIDAINTALGYNKNIDKKDYNDYYFGFSIYHNRWKEPTSLKNIIGNINLYKGYQFNKSVTIVAPQDKYEWINEEAELDKENEDVLIDLINYIKSNNLNTLFVVPIRYFEKEANMKLNKVIEVLEDNGFKVINFNTLEDFNIDYSHDFYNNSHLNVYGSTKYTLYFSKYLKENYELQDHRGDRNYSSWDKVYKKFKARFKRTTKQDFDELLANDIFD